MKGLVHFSKLTRDYWILAVNRFTAYLNRNGIDGYHTVTEEHIFQWIKYLNSKGIGVEGVYYNVRIISHFFKFLLLAKGESALNPLLTPMKSVRIRPITNLQFHKAKAVDTLLQILKANLIENDNFRDFITISILLNSPLGIKDVLELKDEDIDLEKAAIFYKGASYTLPVDLINRITEYKILRDKRIVTKSCASYLIRSLHGHSLNYSRLVKRDTYRRWSFLASAKINSKTFKDIYFHEQSKQIKIEELARIANRKTQSLQKYYDGKQ